MCGILTFRCDDHYRLSNATSVLNLCTFSGCLMAKLTKNDIRQNMTQMTSLIAVATVFANSNIYILQSEGGGAYM